MNIFLAGGGRVGFHLARLLSAEHHSVTVIEADPNRVEQIDYSLDVRCIAGSAASVMLMKESGVDHADLFVSVTGSDEVNLIAAATAKGLGAAQAVARVDQLTYVESHILYETILGVDYILSPDALTAREIARFVENPGMVADEQLGRGHVQLRQMRITRLGDALGKPVRDMTLPQGVLIGIIGRRGKMIIPRGDSVLELGDVVTFVGAPRHMAVVQEMFHGEEPEMKKIFIMGGASIGLHLAQILENKVPSIKLLDWDLKRCKELAGILKKSRVVCRDATTYASLEQEHAGDADAFIATTGDDERNIMASILAKEVGASRCIAVVHQPDFAPLVGRLGIDHAVTPRASLANRVLKLVHQKQFSSSVILEEGQVEILEFAVQEGAPIVNRKLKEIKFPRESLAAILIRGEEVIVPVGDTQVRAGDSFFVIVTPTSFDPVQKLFRP